MDKKTPQIRFRGFSDDWENRKFGEMYEKVSEKNDMSFKKDKIISVAKMYFKKDISISNKNYLKTYNIFKLGDIAFEGNKNKKFSYGRFVENTIGDGIVSHVFEVFRPIIKYDLFYWKYVINNENLMKNTLRKSTKSSTMMTTLVVKDFLKESILVPNILEQNKIGKALNQLDNLITLHQHKCDNLKSLKASLLQKMFPKDGETTPKIRFNGFSENWEQRKFEDYYKMSAGYAFKCSDYVKNGVKIVNGESIKHGEINTKNFNCLPINYRTKYKEFLVSENDIVVGLNRPITDGSLKIARITKALNHSLLYQRAGKIDYKKTIDHNFTYVLLSKEILKHTLREAIGSDQPFISTSKLNKWQMFLPMNKAETIKIGNYFNKIDNLITLHQRKCDTLKKLKEAMLQKMFV